MRKRKVISYEGYHGKITYDLGLRKVTYEHKDIELKKWHIPLSITHMYQIKEDNQGYGKGFRINLEQELRKINETEYRLVMADGTEESFDELYYVKKNKQREYISKDNITIKPDGQLEYNGKKVYKEIKNHKGIKLSLDYTSFIDGEKYDFRNQELQEIETEILEIKQNIESLDYNIKEYSKYSNENYLALLESQQENENQMIGFTSYKNGKTYTDNMTAYYEEKNNYYRQTKKEERPVGGLDQNLDFDSNLVRMTYGCPDAKQNGYYADKYAQLAEYGPVGNTDEMKIDSLSLNEKCAKYYAQEFQNEIDVINQRIQDALNAVESEMWSYQKSSTNAECKYLKNKKAYDEEVLVAQQEHYEKILPLTIELKSYYEKLLNVKEFEKERLLKIIPQRYLSSDNHLVYGFNEEGKLCTIFDAFKHQIIIEYNDLNRIKEVFDEQGNKLQFIYNDSNELIEIYEADDNYITYEYDENGYLTKITYPDQNTTTLEYNYGYLYKYIDINKQGYYILYINGVVTQIRKLIVKAGNTERYDGIEYFTYSDYFVTVSNNKNNLVTNYLFDTDNYIITEYSMKSEQLYELTTTGEEEKCCSYIISTDANHKKIELKNRITLNASHPTEGIAVASLINTYSTDYVVYAFAEANSELSIRKLRKTAYCSHGSEEGSVYFEIRCSLIYGDESIVYCTPFNPSIKSKQLVALPITLKEDTEGKAILPDSMMIYLDYQNNRESCEISNVTLALGDYVYSEYNEAYNKTSDYFSETITPKTVMGERQGNYVAKKKIDYIYNSNEFVEKQIETIDYEEYDLTDNLVASDTKIYTKSYKYNSNQQLSYEEDSKGNIVEYSYNDQGICIMKKGYYKSLPNQAYIEQLEYNEHGEMVSEANLLGYKEEYTTINDANQIITSPNGNILYITSGPNTKAISSDADGIENYNTSVYEFDRIIENQTNGMKYSYRYDEYGRESELYINDKHFCSFEYFETSTTLSYKTIYSNHAGYERITDKFNHLLRINKIIANTPIEYIQYELDSNDRIIKEIQYKNKNTYITNYNYIDNALASITNDEYTKVIDYDMYGKEKETTYQMNENIIKYQSEYTEDILNKYILKYNDEIIYQEAFKKDKLNRIVRNTNTLSIENYTYLSKNGRATNLIAIHQKNINGKLQEYKYNYDKEGNIISKVENQNHIRYTYDSLNRLIREDNKGLNKTYIYTYDSNGNILSKGIYDYTLDDTLENEQIIRYNYNDFNDILSSYNGQTIEYDSMGNPTLYKDKVLSWDQRDLISYDKCSFEYNNNHIRTSKNTEKRKIEYILDGNMILKERITNYITYFYIDEAIDEGQTVDEYTEEIEYIYSKQGIIGFKYHNEIYYYNKNIQGDIIEIYDSKYNLVGKYEYDAWGNHQIIVNINQIADINPFRYRSYYYDSETQLYWVSSRYYSPELCRWISPDSIEYLDPESINGLNLYAYCENDPVNKYDPTGHSAILIGLIIGAVIGFGAAAYIDYQDDGEIFNGSVKWYDYLGATVLGGAIGAGLGAFAGMSFSATLPTGFAMAQTSAGTMALVATGSMTLTVTGAEILGVAGLLGATYMFAKGGLPNNKHQNQQWAEAMRQLGIKDKDLWRRLHNEIHKHPYQNNLRDLLKLLREILQKWGKL